ncbi:MAG: outer membrane beta-barrel protein [Cryomorphaceae bacterium]|nr:outer membrane beta-barrel protein [Cryomorphaceae bacterium]MBT3684461.1 outer membrane beta-barrel protein [Cryomorphaceae bacterium]MBT4813954.1 outer membrane beta-barrel protein [Cryomorphaceae bacterium]MBT5417555.1 outer membrane beta-barrel protein [Cryomorphaceae bacterium]MBT6224658.1 outer membrane beta-barrel protein [Cryomorphaceae bacterium]
MRHILILFILFSTNLIAQGNLGVNFGLNDDNFGAIENISNKVDNYNLDVKNSTGFQFGVFTEIDLITFYIRPELNLIFSKSNNATAFEENSILDQSINIAEHSYKSTDIQVPIIFGYKVLGPISVFAGPSFKYSLSNSSTKFDLEEIKDKYTLSLLIGSRVKFRSLSLGLRYERGLNNKEILIINAKGVDIENSNIDITTNKLSLNLSYDIPYGLFKKKNN